MFDGLLYAAFYGFLLAFAIGPVFFTLIETAITKGFRAALSFELGAITADVIFITIAFFSTSKILEKLKHDSSLLIFGGVVLIAYGIISYIKTKRSIFRIVRDHYNIEVKKKFGSLFLKGFILNFVNFGVLAGWIGTLIMANALTTTDSGIFWFIFTVLVVFFTTDLAKMALAKKLKSRMTHRFIFKTKQWVSILIFGFGIILLVQGIFPNKVQAGLERLPGTPDPLEKPIPPVEKPI